MYNIEKFSKRLLLTTVKHALSVLLYEGIIFLSYFKEKRVKKCQRTDFLMPPECHQCHNKRSPMIFIFYHRRP